MVITGLAPAAHGANRTGRMFADDRTGDLLFATLHGLGLASQAASTRRDDGLELNGVRVTTPVRCAPPGNRPTPGERDTCRPWLVQELRLLRPTVRSVVVLGAFGWQAAMPALEHGMECAPAPPGVRAQGTGGADGCGRVGRRGDGVRLLSRQPAQRLHRSAHPGDTPGGARRGCVCGRSARGRKRVRPWASVNRPRSPCGQRTSHCRSWCGFCHPWRRS
ncbi:uracil-DNA glycosylase family protein [Streptomyces sp. 3N207]|uniref:uracil-DNA glycosylase family protein n=1 Tax=Streptomyces sp. 3N207 TaxID=3457417 RepID=UPI003FD53FF2